METKFNHSIKVPNQYKKAAKVLKNSLERGASVKEQIFSEKHAVNEILFLQLYINFKPNINFSENKSFVRIDIKILKL